jgi:hypothetical protein
MKFIYYHWKQTGACNYVIVSHTHSSYRSSRLPSMPSAGMNVYNGLGIN